MNVLQLQRFSIHDGPGIRTTVFMKGCPLSCKWCHNPESWHSRPDLAYIEGRCVGCKACIASCPSKALTFEDNKVRISRDKCLSCFTCASVCTQDAWKVYGMSMNTDDIVSSVLRDKKYYDRSGGGVTFSGGEPLSQATELCAALKKLTECGIHTAVETSLFTNPSTIDMLIPYVDLWMVDIKHMNNERHLALTGVPSIPILEGICKLSESLCSVTIRVPVVEGESGTSENMEAMADFLLSRTDFRNIELLTMHKLAEHKYASLGRQYPAADYEVPSKESMLKLKEQLTLKGLNAIIPNQK